MVDSDEVAHHVVGLSKRVVMLFRLEPQQILDRHARVLADGGAPLVVLVVGRLLGRTLRDDCEAQPGA